MVDEKSTTELQELSLEEFCKYLGEYENSEDYDVYTLEERDRTKHYVYVDKCLENNNNEKLKEFLSSMSKSDHNIIQFREMLTNEKIEADESLLQWLKEIVPKRLHYHVKKFFYNRTQDLRWGVGHHYDNIDYAKKFATTAFVDLEVSDLKP
jgi:hypothetical protein